MNTSLSLLSSISSLTCLRSGFALFESQIDLEVRVKMFFQQLVPDKSHTTHGTLELDSIEKLNLRQNGAPTHMCYQLGVYLLFKRLQVFEGWSRFVLLELLL